MISTRDLAALPTIYFASCMDGLGTGQRRCAGIYANAGHACFVRCNTRVTFTHHIFGKDSIDAAGLRYLQACKAIGGEEALQFDLLPQLLPLFNLPANGRSAFGSSNPAGSNGQHPSSQRASQQNHRRALLAAELSCSLCKWLLGFY